MKQFTGNPADLPEVKVDEKNGKAFDENVLFLPADGPGQKLAQAGVKYAANYYEAVAKGTQKTEKKKPKASENKTVAPSENK